MLFGMCYIASYLLEEGVILGSMQSMASLRSFLAAPERRAEARRPCAFKHTLRTSREHFASCPPYADGMSARLAARFTKLEPHRQAYLR